MASGLNVSYVGLANDLGLDRQMRHNIEAIRAQGLPERFLRMWEFYLCYCEGGFLERSIGDVQLVLAKPAAR